MSKVEVIEFEKMKALWDSMDGKAAFVDIEDSIRKGMSKDDWKHIKTQVSKSDNVKFACTLTSTGKRYFFHTTNEKHPAIQIVDMITSVKKGKSLDIEEIKERETLGGWSSEFVGSRTTCGLF